MRVYVLVGHLHELCQHGRTDRDSVSGVDSSGPNEPCIRWGPKSPPEGAIFGGWGVEGVPSCRVVQHRFSRPLSPCCRQSPTPKKLPGTGTYKWCISCKYQYQYLKPVLKYSSSTSTSTQYCNSARTCRGPPVACWWSVRRRADARKAPRVSDDDPPPRRPSCPLCPAARSRPAIRRELRELWLPASTVHALQENRCKKITSTAEDYA